MSWKRLVPRRPSSRNGDDDYADEERETREAWRYASRLVDRGSLFLPANCHQHGNGATTPCGGGEPDLLSSAMRLSVLCVATAEEVHWYLQGQYRILSVPHGLDDNGGAVRGVDLACSPDLGALLVTANNETCNNPSSHPSSTKVRLYRTPLLHDKRFDLQFLSASYLSVFSHLRDFQRGIRAALDSWRTALRPLDRKFDGLLSLLSKYGTVDPPGAGDVVAGASIVRRALLRHVLTGRSAIAGDASGALDQFFTRPQMHDQFLQREARGVEAGAASVEGALRSKVLGSVRALAYCTEELYGRASGMGGVGPSSSSSLADPQMALRLHAASRALFLAFDRCLCRVVEARGRLRDLLAWVRGTASAVRARGTAADSVQRRNARNRRVGDGVARRVAAFLSGPAAFAAAGCGGSGRSSTECIIGTPLSDFFVDGKSRTDCDKENVPLHYGTECIYNLESIVQSIFRICTVVFDRPRTVFAQSLSTLDICFEAAHSLMAIHTRIGAGSNATSVGEGNDTGGIFVPQTEEPYASVEDCPFWTLLARSLGTTVELIAIPSATSSDQGADAGFYLRANLTTPESTEVTNIAFYSDDGISSLSPDLNDDAEIREGRQSLGFIVKRGDPVSGEVREELCLFEYDNVSFGKFNFDRNLDDEVIISTTKLSADDCTYLALLDGETSDAISTIVPRRRLISTYKGNIQTQQHGPQVDLCGSRGTGGVITYGASTSLDIFDLEEDEDNESSEGDDDDGDNEYFEEDGSTT